MPLHENFQEVLNHHELNGAWKIIWGNGTKQPLEKEKRVNSHL